MASILTSKIRVKNKKRACPATQKVLETYELLENILVQLTPLGLRLAQQVSKTWGEVITRSRILDDILRADNKESTRSLKLLLLGTSSYMIRSLLSKWCCPKHNFCAHNAHDGEYTHRKQVILEDERWTIEVRAATIDFYDIWGLRSERWGITQRITESKEPIEVAMRQVDAYAFVYNDCDRASFECIPKWNSVVRWCCRQEPYKTKGVVRFDSERSTAPLVGIIATKSDLEYRSPSTVPSKEGSIIARMLHCQFFKASESGETTLHKALLDLARAYRATKAAEGRTLEVASKMVT